MRVTITPLNARADARGSSFTLQLPFDRMAECHVATVSPGQVRGNHFHTVGRELLTILHSDGWTLLWDLGAGTAVEEQSFEGSGAVQIDIPPGCAHAVRNNGVKDLQLVSISDTPRTVGATDTLPRKLF